MKRILLSLLIVFLLTLHCIAQQSEELFWKGVYVYQEDVAPQIIELTINESANKASLSIVGAPVEELPLRMYHFSTDSVYFSVPVLNATFKGKRKDGNVIGTWVQAGFNTPLTFTPSKKEVFARPQTPKPPYPYKEENVIYYNQDKSIQYGATLTYPKDMTAFATVILITGSGQQDRDETIFKHKPFHVIADQFSRNDIAVLRVDDRCVGQTTGDVQNATSEDFSKDVLAGVQYLKQRKDIDLQQIGLVGHSEGCNIALLAARKNSDITFIISLGGPGVAGTEIAISQYKHEIKKAYPQLSPQNLEKLVKLQHQLFNIAIKPTDKDTAVREMLRAKDMWRNSQDSLTSVIGGFTYKMDMWVQSSTHLNHYLTPWMRYALAFRPDVVMQQIDCPILFLNGEKDRIIFCDLNMQGFQKIIRKLQKKNMSFKQYPDLNHFFQHCQTGELEEVRTIEETFAPGVITDMIEWIKTVTRK